jgi:tripartite ATP-independent transporter DctP family solute receptor
MEGKKEEDMKKVLTAVLVLLMLFTPVACGGGGGSTTDAGDSATTEAGDSDSSAASADSKVTLHFGSTVATTHAWYRAGVEFQQAVAEKSDGSIEIVLDFGGVHGSDKEHCEAVQAGTLDIAIDSTVGVDAVVTKLGFVNLPYLMTSYEDVDGMFYNGWIGETATRLVGEAGMTVLGWVDCDFRWMTNSVRPITSVDDLKGMKMRTPEAPMYLRFFENLGTIPTAIPFNDLPNALQQKVVDGQDNGPVLTYTAGLADFQQYMTKTNHAFAAACFYINTDTFNSLTDNQKSVLTECAKVYSDTATAYLRDDTTKFADEMAGGSEIIEVTPEFDKAMKDAAKKVWADEEVTKAFDQDAVKRILEEYAVD